MPLSRFETREGLNQITAVTGSGARNHDAHGDMTSDGAANLGQAQYNHPINAGKATSGDDALGRLCQSAATTRHPRE